ncbi:MAG TPA: hypothetical protein VJ692_12185 [Nitrospiraceae bacterium]|nr:hypothetical protein [Nitrospiraceae bacterium]
MDIKPGQQYESGTRVRHAAIGISFIIPADWMGGTAQGSRSFLLGSNTMAGVGIVVLLDHVTPQELESHMNEPQVLDEGFVLQPVSSARMSGDRMTASYHAGENVGRAVAVFGPSNQAIVYLLTGPKDLSVYYGTLLDQLAASTRFTTIDTAALVKQWEGLLAGMALKHLEQYSSGSEGGYNRSTVWNLCRDGRFTYSHSSHVTMQVPGGGASDAGEEHRRGTWRVEAKGLDVSLILTEDNGAVTSHAVSYDGEKTYVDGERVFRVNGEECE